MAITVDYSRVPGYPQENVSRKGVTVVDKLQCDWADRITLAKELAGFLVGSVLHLPHEYDFGDEPINNIYVTDVHSEPIVALDAATGDYPKALLTVNYGNLEYDVGEIPAEAGSTVYVTESLESQTEFITLTHKGLAWDAGKTIKLADTEAPSKLLHRIDWVYTIHQMLGIPAWLWTHPGTVNSAGVTSRELGKYFAAETLLFGNPSLSREVTSEGTTAWTITCRFSYQPDTWNKYPRTATGGTLANATVYDTAGAAKKFYSTSDFGSIVL